VLARSWLVLLWTALAVLVPVAMPRGTLSQGSTTESVAVSPRLLDDGTGPHLESAGRAAAISVGHIPLVSDLGAPSSAEVISALARGVPVGHDGEGAYDYLSGGSMAPPARAAATWCDPVQCCRQRGMQLLRYATAPPTHV